MRVLVAGSEGSLAQAVIPLLLAKGLEVVGVDNFSRYGRLERPRPYEFVEGDLCDRDLVRRLMTGADAVFQSAATIYGVDGFHRYPADILARDVLLHENVLWEAVAGKLKKVVYVSSSMVYERSETVPSREEDVDEMPVPRTDYGLSKLIGERLCHAFGSQYGLVYTIWRPFNIITPHEKAGTEQGLSHVFADFIRRLVIERQNPLPIFGDGEQIRCFTWIGDVARALADYSLDSRTDGEVFNLGNPAPVTMKELALKIHLTALRSGALKDRRPLMFEHLSTHEDDVRIRIPSIEKARRILGWEPSVSLEEALERCVAHAPALYRTQ